MVVLEGGLFLMSEVPLYQRSSRQDTRQSALDLSNLSEGPKAAHIRTALPL